MRPHVFSYAPLLATLSLLAAVLAPARARAAPLTSLAYELGNDTAMVTLGADQTPRRPRVRTDAGLVRLWFPDARGTAIWDLEGDGRALRGLELRPGVSGSALVVLHLADGRTIDPADVMVMRSRTGATIHIARDALPFVDHPPVAAPAPEPAHEPPMETATATVTETPTADATEAEAEPVLVADSETPTPSERSGLFGRPAPTLAAQADSSGGLPYGLLLALTAILGGLHLLLKAFSKRGRLPLPESSIDVVASKRLGTRHQLLLVRALGEEHLLSVNGNQLQHLSTAPAGAGLAESFESGEASPAFAQTLTAHANPETPAFVANMAARLAATPSAGTSALPLPMPLPTPLPTPAPVPALAPALPPSPLAAMQANYGPDAQPRLGLEAVGANVPPDDVADRFGDKLLRLAEKREDDAALGLADKRPPSAAVAGLLRLRAKARQHG